MVIGDIIVLAVLGLIVGSIIGSIIQKKKKGSHCGCTSCQGCAMAGKCHSQD